MKPKTAILLALLAALLLTPTTVEAKKAKNAAEEAEDDAKLSAKTLSGLELRNIGPALMSGRIADIVIHPESTATWYVAVGSGGVWKTENSGTTWESIFDGQGSYSIGCVTLDPSHPHIVWVGSGENVGGRHVGYGDGIYKSLDGGASWENMGLGDSEHIGNIVVDPNDSNTVYAAVQGPLWSAGGQRGLFKTTDGGSNWENILSGGEYTGVNEVHLDPRDSNVIYAVTHQKTRNVAALINGGPETAIHKSTDGGASWRELESGLPDEDKGKIGLAISPIDPDVLYATVELSERTGGFYRSDDGGASWEKRNDYISGATGPHYYQEIFASPHQFDRIYQMDNRLQVTHDGGNHFERVPEEFKHGDNHAMAFHPSDPNYLLNGSDGGIYESWDLGKNWKFVSNLPVTQFYKVAIDYDEPFYNVIGGTQDNNTQYGPSRTLNVNGIRNSDWIITLFADGHQPAIDPSDPNIIYSEWQEGNLTRYDRQSGEVVYIQPQPGKGEAPDRFNWDSPILISPHDPATLFFASQRVWRSDDRGDSWTAISGDLTRDLDRLEQPMMGRVWSFDAIWDLWAMSKYSTITSLAQSPLDDQLIYAGSDDGLIQVTEDGGQNWRQIDSLPGVATKFFVNDIKADLHDVDTVYVAVDQHKTGDFAPYLYKSTDRGASWKSIAGDLPERHLVWRMVQDHVKPNLLFVGTEFGVFVTLDGGSKWLELEGNAPTIPFRDLAIQTRENDLVAATFGRGFWILDDYSPLREISEEALAGDAIVFPVRDALWYLEKRPLGRGTRATQGAGFYIADNPPFGATFTYYLKDSLETRKQKRRSAEKETEEEGGDTPYPGWEAMRLEEIEEEPTAVLTVRNASGTVIRHLKAPGGAGIHRVSWNLRYPYSGPVTGHGGGDDFFGAREGFLAAPGTYSVSLSTWMDGVFTDTGQRVDFEVRSISERGLKGADIATVTGFYRQIESFDAALGTTRVTIDQLIEQLGLMKQAILSSQAEGDELYTRAHQLERSLLAMQERLDGNERRGNFGDPGVVSISGRLGVVQIGNSLSTYGPTEMHQQQFEIAKQEHAELRGELETVVDDTVPALAKALEAAGVPWSTGRPLPAVAN